MSLQGSFPAYGGRGPTNVRLGIALGTLATIFLALRIYIRLRINRFGTTALLLCLLSWILTAVSQCLAILSSLYGAGNHQAVVMATGHMHLFLVYSWTTVLFFTLAIPCGKVAAVAFLIEMSAKSSLKIKRSLLALAVLNTLLCIPQALLIWLQCDPPGVIWTPSQQHRCNFRISVYYTYATGAIAAASDLYLALIPIAILTPVRINKSKKAGLCLLMGIGVVASAAAIIRTWAAQYTIAGDTTYGVGLVFSWVEVEEWLVLICMSVPTVWPLFRPSTQRAVRSVPSIWRRTRRMYSGQSASHSIRNLEDDATSLIALPQPVVSPRSMKPPLASPKILLKSGVRLAEEDCLVRASRPSQSGTESQ